MTAVREAPTKRCVGENAFQFVIYLRRRGAANLVIPTRTATNVSAGHRAARGLARRRPFGSRSARAACRSRASPANSSRARGRHVCDLLRLDVAVLEQAHSSVRGAILLRRTGAPNL